MPQATFVLKEPQTNLKDPKDAKPTLVYLLYHFNSTKLKYSTSQKILPKNWNAEKQRAKELRSFPEYSHFNFVLDKIETAVNTAYRTLIIEDVTPTPDLLRKALDEALNKKESSKDYLSFAQSVLYASDRKEVTKKSIQQTLNVLKDYKDYSRKPLYFDSIDLDFYNDFIDYLTNKRNLKQLTIGNHIKNVKVFIREAFERGLTKNTFFQSRKFKSPYEEAHTIYLSEKEIGAIYDLDLTLIPKLDRIRDLFIVGCYTGLRFSDLTQLNIESINQQKQVIKVKTQKTQELVIIPIKGMVKEVIEKYEGQLPKSIDNSAMNIYLKEIGQIAGITEPFERVATKGGKRVREVFKKHELITVHTARRSFATNAYLSNVPSISIMKITGHRTERSFLKYIKISQEDNANKLINHPFFV